MIGNAVAGWSGALAASALMGAACGGSTGQGVGAGGANSGAAAAGQTGKSLDTFDPCSVVSDSELVQAITAEAGDPSALGTINPAHAPVDAPKRACEARKPASRAGRPRTVAVW